VGGWVGGWVGLCVSLCVYVCLYVCMYVCVQGFLSFGVFVRSAHWLFGLQALLQGKRVPEVQRLC
jgi:hypothetical protein